MKEFCELTDNELIAEFMKNDAVNSPDKLPAKLLQYDTSWDWLMQVVERISENYDFIIQFYDGECNCFCTKQTYDASDIPGVGHGGFTPKIESVYKSVVAFVKWYAKNKPLKY